MSFLFYICAAQAGNTSKVVYWINKMRNQLGHPRASVYEKCVHLIRERGLGSRDVNIRNAETVYLWALKDGIAPTKTMIDAVEDIEGISVAADVERMHQLHLTSSFSITP
jgi:hypothetical protein